ncbi:MAG: M1 family aminopeptidase [Desulfobacterales bacterium]|nr:M1 family aminopeptidase [Desulfobacterales bacterium]
MKKTYLVKSLVFILVLFPLPVCARANIHHEMNIVLLPEKHWMQVEDTITIPQDMIARTGGKLNFTLHGGMAPVSTSPDVSFTQIRPADKDEPPIEHYAAVLPGDINTFTILYKGKIFHPVRQSSQEYARSFSQTPGAISEQGIFLGGETGWYPRFSHEPITFVLTIQTPGKWNIISQGVRAGYSSDAAAVRVRWESPEPQHEIYLVGGRLIEYRRSGGSAEAMVLLHDPEEGLAEKYLEATGRYIQMYSALIGPYPYRKFALVENFWETGYGMPSFTLLGPKIIRFPFILHSSYPHEILHNWWGNGVFVDPAGGNWSEGLTAYLADHLIREQAGTAAEYRRSTLQKYTDYVIEGKDFPIAEFRSRHNSSTEAIGYGKTLMFFHMLRMQLGDETFTKGLQTFYQNNKFKRASFENLRKTFEKVSGLDLTAEFTQWVTRTGAPDLKVSDVQIKADKGLFRLTATIEQVQKGPHYRIYVPVAVYIKGQEKPYQTSLFMDDKRLAFSVELNSPPLRLDVDPEFDLFRRLDRNETPSAFSQAFGSDKVLIILPATANRTMLDGYRQLGKSWRQSQTGQIEIKLDSEINKIPLDKTLWLLGWENRFLKDIAPKLSGYGVSVSDGKILIHQNEFTKDQHSVALSIGHPQNPDLALAWLAAGNAAALAGLGRKLPHYGKYSYLAFEGHEPRNILQGQWPTYDSPLSVPVQSVDGTFPKNIRANLKRRPALADPPAFISKTPMLD